jgi:hypothetical protein
VRREHQAIAAERVAGRRFEDREPGNPTEITRRPHEQTVAGAGGDATARPERGVKRTRRGAVGKVSAKSEILQLALARPVVGFGLSGHALDDLARRQRIALGFGEISVHPPHRRSHGGGADEAAQRPGEELAGGGGPTQGHCLLRSHPSQALGAPLGILH